MKDIRGVSIAVLIAAAAAVLFFGSWYQIDQGEEGVVLRTGGIGSRAAPDGLIFNSDGEFGGVQATTAGFYAVTPDHNPFLDVDPAVPNLIRLVGFSGHGAMFGPFTAAVARAGRCDSGAPWPTPRLC